MPHLVQILLPAADNAGQPFPAGHYHAIRTKLTRMFGGLTAYTRAPAEGFWNSGVAAGPDGDVAARFVLLATGLVDHCPPLAEEPTSRCPDAIRFCPVCDGYEAINRRIGVIGDIVPAGKKARFLRTYTKSVALFVTDERADDPGLRSRLEQENITIRGKPQHIHVGTDGTVAITTESGEQHKMDGLYPALGCEVRSGLATALGAACTENRTIMVDDHQRTTVEGLYAAGDVVTDLHQ
jgi:thioredoxin reductase (NADPH)